MASIQDSGICVRHWDWSETSQTVSILTREHGIIRGLAKGSRREKSVFSGGIELLTQGELLAVVKPGGNLATLTAWNLTGPYRGLRERLVAFYAGMYAADLVNHLVLDSDPHPEVFDALEAALTDLAARVEPRAETDMVVLRFQWAVLQGIGTRPDTERDVVQGQELEAGDVVRFVPGMGGFTAHNPDGASNGWKVRSSTLDLLRRLPKADPLADAESVRRAVRLLGAYVHFLIGKELGSLAPVVGG